MGRHRAPSTAGAPGPRAPLAVGAGALAVVLALLVAVFVATQGDTVTTARRGPHPSSSASGPAVKPTGTAVPSTGASSPAPSPTQAARPPTLRLRLTGKSFVSVRRADGRILVSGLYHRGAHKTFDQKDLRVTLGNSGAVRVTINGKAREPGRKGAVENFRARRK